MIKSIIVAVAQNGVIGKNNDLIWHLPGDLRYFKETTKGHYVIMGRKTFESFGKPLINRTNIIVTRNPDYHQEGCIIVNSLEKALQLADKDNQEEAFILGGGEIYRQAMDICDRLYITEIKASFEGDTYFPTIDEKNWKEVKRIKNQSDQKNKYPYDFVVYERKI